MTSTRAQLLPLQGGATPRVGGGGTPRSSLQSPTATPRRSPSPLHPEDPQRQQKSTLLLERMGVGRVCTTTAGTDEAPPPPPGPYCVSCVPAVLARLFGHACRPRSSHPVLRARAAPPRSPRLESRSRISSQPSAAAAAGVRRRPRPRRKRSACVPCRCEPPGPSDTHAPITPCYSPTRT